MSIFLLIIVGLILLYSVLRQNVGIIACFSILYFNIAASLFHAISPALFSLNAVFHIAFFLLLLIWQFNYYSWRTILNYITNPVIVSVLAISVVIYVYNGYSPYYTTHKALIESTQYGFYSRILFPLLLLPMMLPDNYSRRSMMNFVPFWGTVYVLVFIFTFNISSNVLSDRMVFEEATEGITGPISLSRTFAVATIATVLKAISMNEFDMQKRNLYILFAVLFFLVMLITGQRGTLIGLSLGFVMLLARDKWRRHSFTIFLLLIIALVPLSLVGIGELEIFQRFSQFQNIESFERYHDYIRTWEIFKNNNYFWGLGSLGYLFKTGRCWPHNIILEHISDYGLVGLVCILFLLYFCAKYAFTIIRHSNDDGDIAIACSWIVLCFSAMVSSTLLNHQEFYCFSGLLAMTYLNHKKSSEDLFGIDGKNNG